MTDSLKLTVYFGESDRVGHRLVSDELLDVFERAGLQAAVLMRAVEGFGIKHKLRTQRFLTLSEDLPLVAVAVDRREAIEGVLAEVKELVGGGLITLERARLSHGESIDAGLTEALHEETKLTLYLGRDERSGNRPAYVEVVEHLRRHGLAGATVLLGVDGLMHGHRQRARFFARNASVPLMVVSVGPAERIAAGVRGPRRAAAGPGAHAGVDSRVQTRRCAPRRATAPPRAGRRRARDLAEADGLRGRAGASRRASRCTSS